MLKKEERPCVSVVTYEDDYYLKLELSEKTESPHLNRFFVELVREKGKVTNFSISVSDDNEDKERLVTGVLPLKDLRKFQDDILDVIDTVGMGKRLALGDKFIYLVHFQNEEIGLAAGPNKFLLQEKEISVLRAFAAKIIN